MGDMIIINTFGLWFVYIVVMWLKRHKDTLPKSLKLLGYVFATVGIILDALYNVIIGTIMFLDPPREWLFTSRLKRYRNGKGWRLRLADFFCEEMLNPHDPDHC